ncbi:MAG TPA: hypothetical protein VFF28_05875 [Candidatus Nanoarchaeia archaeon]|nr:hypothetical protein [Candidatus Nanoarchaeia archaeon]
MPPGLNYAGVLLLALIITGCQEVECNKDSDCFPAECCHPTSCTNIKPDCDGRFCSMNCAPGTMDCGQGYCGCVDNKCSAVIQ